jgi:HD domain
LALPLQASTPPAVRRYVVVICLLAAVVGAYCAIHTHQHWVLQIFLAVLFIASRQVRLRVRPSGKAALSLSGLIGVISFPLLGAFGALAALAPAVIPNRSLSLLQRLYNIAATSIAVFAGGLVYVALGGPVRESLLASGRLWAGLGALAVGMGVLFFVNLLALSAVLYLDARIPVLVTLRHLADLSTLGQLLFGFIGFMVAQLWLGTLGPTAAILLLLPLVVGQFAIMQSEGDQRVYQATLRALAKALETKDPYTRGHGERVGGSVGAITKAVGWTPDRIEMATAAGLLHDVGKIAVPTTVIRKSTGLSSDELATFRLHPLRGVEVVRGIGFLDDAVAGIRHHHERFDGGGYPAGLEGYDIPVVARVIGVADAYDAMTTARTYRAPLEPDDAIAELRRSSGNQFDPEFVTVFVELIESGRFTPATAAGPGAADLADKTPSIDLDDPVANRGTCAPAPPAPATPAVGE